MQVAHKTQLKLEQEKGPVSVCLFKCVFACVMFFYAEPTLARRTP